MSARHLLLAMGNGDATPEEYDAALVEFDALAAHVRELEEALREANEVIHAEGYDDPHDKLRSLAVIVGFALTPEGPKP